MHIGGSDEGICQLKPRGLCEADQRMKKKVDLLATALVGQSGHALRGILVGWSQGQRSNFQKEPSWAEL